MKENQAETRDSDLAQSKKEGQNSREKNEELPSAVGTPNQNKSVHERDRAMVVDSEEGPNTNR